MIQPPACVSTPGLKHKALARVFLSGAGYILWDWISPPHTKPEWAAVYKTVIALCPHEQPVAFCHFRGLAGDKAGQALESHSILSNRRLLLECLNTLAEGETKWRGNPMGVHWVSAAPGHLICLRRPRVTRPWLP